MTWRERILNFLGLAVVEPDLDTKREAGEKAADLDETGVAEPPAAAAATADPDDEADFASHMGEIVPLILEMAETTAGEGEGPSSRHEPEKGPSALETENSAQSAVPVSSVGSCGSAPVASDIAPEADPAAIASAAAENVPDEPAAAVVENAGEADASDIVPEAEPVPIAPAAAENVPDEPAATVVENAGEADASDIVPETGPKQLSGEGEADVTENQSSVAPAEIPQSGLTAEEPSRLDAPALAVESQSASAQERRDVPIKVPQITLPPFKQKRVVVSLLKGGVGKTTITCFLATAIQKLWDDAGTDGRLLVVDTDPQGSATDFFLEGEAVGPERSLRALFAPFPFPGAELIRHTRYSRIDLIAAHPSMADVAPTADDRLEDHLAWYLENEANEYSVILIDTPPSDTLALRNALMASSGIFMPLDPSRQSLRTFIQFSQTVKRYKDRNRALRIYGVIFSRYDKRQSLDRSIRETIGEQLSGSGLKLYEVPRRAAIADCYNNYTAYEALDPKKEEDAARTFRDLAMQVLSH